jgi:ABC-type nickel/cobalt efflux system permease component RcnA
MNQQPDKLFREKLEGFHKPAPTAAWNKIDAGLRKKNNKTIWLRVAASVLLVAVAAFLIWTTQRTPAEQIAIDTNQNNKKESQGQDQKLNQTKAQEKPVLQPEQLESPTAATIVKKPKQTKAIQSLPVTPAQEEPTMIEEPVIEELVSFTSADNAIDSSVVETMDTIEPVVVVSSIEEEKQDQSRVLVLSVEEVNAKYLDKEALAKATSAQKKSSTFRKLLNKAYNLKNNQDPFGELRQKKNEILALNFKSEKRSQNK